MINQCAGSVLRVHHVCREQLTTNLTPSCCGSSQNSCLLLHNDAWIKVTFHRAAFCHAAAILVRKSASPYLGSCPTEGQHEGQRDEAAASEGRPGGAAWSHRKPKSSCFLLTCQHPFLSLTLASLSLFLQTASCRLATLTTQARWGRHQKSLEMKSPFLDIKSLVLEISNAEVKTGWRSANIQVKVQQYKVPCSEAFPFIFLVTTHICTKLTFTYAAGPATPSPTPAATQRDISSHHISVPAPTRAAGGHRATVGQWLRLPDVHANLHHSCATLPL